MKSSFKALFQYCWQESGNVKILIHQTVSWGRDLLGKGWLEDFGLLRSDCCNTSIETPSKRCYADPFELQ